MYSSVVKEEEINTESFFDEEWEKGDCSAEISSEYCKFVL